MGGATKGMVMRNRFFLIVIMTMCLMVTGIFIPNAALSTSDVSIKQQIENKAAENAKLKTGKVKVAVENGFVVLYGSVDRYIQKMLYEKIAWKTEGVIEVENEIRVIPPVIQDDAAIERKVKEIFQTYDRFQSASISVNVKAGVVNVLITLNHPEDLLFLKRRIAEIDGVVSIDIMAKLVA
jgi:osmotically-inducible protein OsmY